MIGMKFILVWMLFTQLTMPLYVAYVKPRDAFCMRTVFVWMTIVQVLVAVYMEAVVL